MRALITGIGGFVGGHLAAYLLKAGDEVSGVGRVSHRAALPDQVRLFETDLRDSRAVEAAVRATQPQAVYHLAAQSSTRDSFSRPSETVTNNLEAQTVLLDALLAAHPAPTVLVVGSSDEYGAVRPDHLPTHEDVPLRPATPYAVSKVVQDVQGFQYFAQYGLPVVRVRPFSHTGPGHDDRFVIPSFAHQVAEIEDRRRPPELWVGNLSAERDFTDVRDMVRAYRLAVTLGEPGEVYNIGSGQSVHLSDALDQLIALCSVPIRIQVDPTRLRPVDIPVQRADTRRFYARTAWAPAIPWGTTLADTLNYWRSRVHQSPVPA